MDSSLQHALNLHRDDECPRLSVQLPIANLVDDGRCEALTRLIQERCEQWERKLAVPTLADMLPGQSGVYMFVWCPKLRIHLAREEAERQFEWILYVGKAADRSLKDRFKGEYRKYLANAEPSRLWDREPPKTRPERLRRYLAIQPLEFWYTCADSPDIVNRIEKQLIKTLNPPLNKSMGPRLRRGATVPAF